MFLGFVIWNERSFTVCPCLKVVSTVDYYDISLLPLFITTNRDLVLVDVLDELCQFAIRRKVEMNVMMGLVLPKIFPLTSGISCSTTSLSVR